MKLGGRVAQVRRERALEQEDICAKVNARLPEGEKPLTQQALSALESRDSATSIHAIRMADALGVSIRWLIDGQGDPAARDWPFHSIERSRWDALDDRGRAAVEGAILLTLAQLEAGESFRQSTPTQTGAEKSIRSSPSVGKASGGRRKAA